jgi:glycerophosphoryl diester phosphodiesterase
MLSRRFFLSACAALPAPASRRVDVIAHRGEHRRHPQNTLPAIHAAIALGVDWVEVDVRATRDGHFVLMHNRTVDATTNGQGAVASLTFAEIRRLDAGIHHPGFHGTPIPTLDEALALLRGHCGVYLDAKSIPATAIVDALKRHAMLDACVVYGSLDLLTTLAAMGYRHLTLPEAVSVANLKRLLATLDPPVIAFDHHDFLDDVIAVARAAGKKIFVDRLGADDHPAAWRHAVHSGATGIQTDRPADVLALLAQLGYR